MRLQWGGVAICNTTHDVMMMCVSLASQPYFSECIRMRVNKFCVGGEGKIRLVTVARFSYRGGM